MVVFYGWSMSNTPLHHVAKKSKKIQAYREGIEDLEAYLNSSKFHENIMVNKHDIFLRLRELKNKIADIDCE